MGFLEKTIGMFLIPAILVILALLANGTGRRVLNKFILGVIGIEVGANGYHFKLINVILFTNLACMFTGLGRIHRIHSLHHSVAEENVHHADPAFNASYQTELNMNYRNILMHICSMVLILCLNVATEQYERYKPIKELAEKMLEDRKKKSN